MYNTISSAERKGRAEGEAIGMQKGEAIGRQKGEVIGRQKGEREEKLRNAKNLKSLGVDVETISKATGLSADEIEKL